MHNNYNKREKGFNSQIDKLNKDEFQPTNDKPINDWPRSILMGGSTLSVYKQNKNDN